ncbi:MAG: CoA-transferase [Betaproteobacteria bacterium]|jgi:glutaconate CoA-transferase subunit A
MTEVVLADAGEIAARIPDGAVLAVAQDGVGVSMATTRALIRRGTRDLHLVCVPISGLQADVLIGAGCVRRVETSAISLGEFGTGPRFAAALRAGSVQIRDATCPAIHAALQAGQKGLPFMPLRGLIGSDVLARRPDWKVIPNPFAEDDPIALLPAIRPDVALFHAPLADRYGNIFIGRNRDLLTMAQASAACFATVESLTDDDLMADPARAPGVIPAIYVSGVACAPRGAAPLRFLDAYAADEARLAGYAREARTEEGFRAWLSAWLVQDSGTRAA